MQAVEQLSLVLVDPLDLHVEHGLWVDLHLVVLLQVGRELHLVLLKKVHVGTEQTLVIPLQITGQKGVVKTTARCTHLFDFGDVADEGFVVHELQEILQLVQVSDVVVTDSLHMIGT